MKRFKKIKENEYKTIKSLLDVGVKASDIMKSGVSTRSKSTLSYIKNTDSFEGYKNMIAKKLEKQKKQEPLKTPVKNNDNVSNEILTLLKELVKNTDRLATAWEKNPKRRWL